MWSIDLVPRAEKEVALAQDWYEARRSGLGRRFLDELDGMLAEIPTRFPRWQDDARYQRAVLARFPYVVFFVADSVKPLATVVAVAHTSQKPGYWK